EEYSNSFEYTFSSESEVYFSNTFVYTDFDWQKFLTQTKFEQNLRIETLGFTPEKRKIKLYRFGRQDAQARILLTCRMHCCESIASFVLEGIITKAAQDDYLRNKVEFAVIPFMDVDGSENGDQGKNRTPHDHNRDFTSSPIHTEVKLLTQYSQLWQDGKLKLGLDLHNPMLASRGDEHVHWVEEELEHIRTGQYCFARLLESNQHSSLKFAFDRISRYGVGHNQKNRPTASAWMSRLPGMQMAMSLETPYAEADHCEVNIASATAFGADIANAIKQFLQVASSSKI
ncbi:MAG: M14 family zinc carboxypeptidase, partial [Victivallaceae bacterium]